MNSIKSKLGALIVTAFAVAIAGCAPATIKDITREHRSAYHLSKADAAAVLSAVSVHSKPYTGRIWKVGSVSETGFDYGEIVTIEHSRRLVSTSIVGSSATSTYEIRYHTEWRQYGTVSFTEITRIEQVITWANSMVSLYGKDGFILKILVLKYSQTPVDKVLSALLVLCPNVQ